MTCRCEYECAYVCLSGVLQCWICFIKETLNQHSEGCQDLSGKMDNRNIHWNLVFVCVHNLCICMCVPTHIICHINRFVHQCTGTGTLFLSVSVAANSGWKKTEILIKKKKTSLSVMTYFHSSNLAWKAAGRAVRPLIKLAFRRSSVAAKEVDSSVRPVSLTLPLTLKIRVELKAGRGNWKGSYYHLREG